MKAHHIGPPYYGLPQSLCHILPCHIMALYQKGTPYWPSSIIMPHIALPYYGIIPKGYTILAFLNHYATYCLAILWHYTKRVHHIHLPQSLCRILPCYIMACESRVVVKVCGVMFCYLGITLQAKSTRRNFQVCLEGTLHS